MARDKFTVTVDRATGAAELRKGDWFLRTTIADLPRWRRFYLGLWERGSKVKGQPGPWARYYEQDLRAIEAAIREAER